jgi:hypothetical protein
MLRGQSLAAHEEKLDLAIDGIVEQPDFQFTIDTILAANDPRVPVPFLFHCLADVCAWPQAAPCGLLRSFEASVADVYVREIAEVHRLRLQIPAAASAFAEVQRRALDASWGKRTVLHPPRSLLETRLLSRAATFTVAGLFEPEITQAHLHFPRLPIAEVSDPLSGLSSDCAVVAELRFLVHFDLIVQPNDRRTAVRLLDQLKPTGEDQPRALPWPFERTKPRLELLKRAQIVPSTPAISPSGTSSEPAMHESEDAQEQGTEDSTGRVASEQRSDGIDAGNDDGVGKKTWRPHPRKTVRGRSSIHRAMRMQSFAS